MATPAGRGRVRVRVRGGVATPAGRGRQGGVDPVCSVTVSVKAAQVAGKDTLGTARVYEGTLRVTWRQQVYSKGEMVIVNMQ